MGDLSVRSRLSEYESVYLRLSLAVGFLSAVTDRLGLWGAYGTPNVAWGGHAALPRLRGEAQSVVPGRSHSFRRRSSHRCRNATRYLPTAWLPNPPCGASQRTARSGLRYRDDGPDPLR